MKQEIDRLIPVSRPSLDHLELEAVKEVFDSAWLGMGSFVERFEEAISEFLGGSPVKSEVIAVNTGTTALHLALEAIGVGSGDEVIVPSLTFAATVQVITALGAIPVFCDIEEATLNIDVRDLEGKVTSKTKVILPVHYRGQPCEMDKILELADTHGLRVVEDAAHAFGSFYRDKRVGTLGDLTCFSFDPIKNITCGEGGAIVTRDHALADRLRKKRVLGIDKDSWSRYSNERCWVYDVTEQGFRYHLSNINAAIGLVQLSKFDSLNERKIFISKWYDDAFRKLDKVEILKTDYEGLALFTYIIKVLENRENLIAFLKGRGIDSGIHYIPVHRFSYFKKFHNAPLPVTDQIGDQILTLPLYVDMTDEQVNRVIEAIRDWCHQ